MSISTAAAQQGRSLRLAVFNPGLSRSGPGLLLQDIQRGSDPQIIEAARVIAAARPDILVLTAFDYDAGLAALSAFNRLLERHDAGFAYLFALPSNAGLSTSLDLNGDGRLNGPEDAQGYGDFPGQRGLALLSRFPVAADGARDFSAFPWRDLPGASGAGRLTAERAQIQRLSSSGLWDVPVRIGGSALHVLAWRAAPPALDGGTGENALRNRDENRFWLLFLQGKLPMKPPQGPFALLGDANLDPMDGAGDHEAIGQLLSLPGLTDPLPAARAPLPQTGFNAAHRGDPRLDTADWDDVNGPGNLRVDYVLPSADLAVIDAGLIWPQALPSARDGSRSSSRHALVWVDVRWQRR